MASDGGRRDRVKFSPAPVISRVARSGAPEAVRHRLVLALDVDDSVLASRWAVRLRPWFGVAKVGLELFSAAGPAAIGELLEGGFKVFVDLKMADIPNTTPQGVPGARGAGGLRPPPCTPRPGRPPSEAAVEGLAEGADRAGLAPPMPWPAPFTSEAEAPVHRLRALVTMARDAGCGRVVCAATDLGGQKRRPRPGDGRPGYPAGRSG